jgi:lysophospholipase L1-like esterase
MAEGPLAAASPRPPSPSRLTRGKKALFLGALLVGVLLVAEGIARVMSKDSPPTIVAHPYLRHVRAPHGNQAFTNPRTGEAYVVHVDAQGFRTQSLTPPGEPKPPGTYRIFFVGASTTENITIPDEQTFPFLVEHQLNERLEGTRVQAVNAGIAGNTVADTLSLIAHRVLALEPDLVVVLHGINDMRAGCSQRFDPAHYADRLSPPQPRLSHLLARYSALYRSVLAARKRMRSGTREERYRARAAKLPLSEGVDPARGLSYFLRYLGMIDALCREAQVPLVIMTQPSLYRPDLDEAELATLWMGYVNHGELHLSTATLQAGMQRYNDAIRAFCAQRKLRTIDLEAALPKNLEHLFDDCHYTAKGNARVAATIVESLLADGALPR